jgi:hypothetical protein
MNFSILKNFLAIMAVTIILILISFFFEFIALSIARNLVVPEYFLEWDDIKSKAYSIYFIIFVSLIAIAYFLLRRFSSSRIVCFICLFVLWLSFPTITHWNVSVLGGYEWRYQGLSDYHYTIVVPHVFVIENSFSIIDTIFGGNIFEYKHILCGGLVEYKDSLTNGCMFFISSAVFFVIILLLHKLHGARFYKNGCVPKKYLIVGLVAWFLFPWLVVLFFTLIFLIDK